MGKCAYWPFIEFSNRLSQLRFAIWSRQKASTSMISPSAVSSSMYRCSFSNRSCTIIQKCIKEEGGNTSSKVSQTPVMAMCDTLRMGSHSTLNLGLNKNPFPYVFFCFLNSISVAGESIINRKSKKNYITFS